MYAPGTKWVIIARLLVRSAPGVFAMSAALTTVVVVKGSTTDKGDCCPRTTTLGTPAAAASGTLESVPAARADSGAKSPRQKAAAALAAVARATAAAWRRCSTLQFMVADHSAPGERISRLGRAQGRLDVAWTRARLREARRDTTGIGSGRCGRAAGERDAEKEKACPLRSEASGGQDIRREQRAKRGEVRQERERRGAAECAVLDLCGVVTCPRHRGHPRHLGHALGGHAARKPVGTELEREQPARRRHESLGNERTQRESRERERRDQLPSRRS